MQRCRNYIGSRKAVFGFTLTELMVTLAIAAVLATLAVPSFQDFIVRSRMNGAAGDFTNSTVRARNEAVSKNTCVSMCLSTTADAASPTCATSGDDWGVGWIVFLNTSCNTALNAPPTAADLLLARVSSADNIRIVSQSTTPVRKFMFSNRGSTSLGSASEFDVIYDNVGSAYTMQYGVNVCMDALGRVRTIPGIKKCNNY